ncbi:bet1-like protein At4g14600 [Rhodamnia argentea]|uniref:Bet1-like protein At4g14600 n=1 Tax=Rhodamnia argentea TaxID=178133 RepID=A0A8B8Q6L9_9MYRT|nr:bet1-like protein At4g14600 [Rhodamnia argentea]
MAGNFHRGGSLYGGAAPYRSQEGLSTRPAGGSDEVQLRIDPMHGDLDDEITGLRKQVRQLRNVAQEIETEATFQNDLLNQLQMTLIKAQAGVKNNVRRLNKSIVQYGSSNVVHVVAFALVCFFFVYLWSKLSKR